jgi:hypothetical protein
MMESKHVINILKGFSEFNAFVRCACLIHHVIVFLISCEPIVSESIGTSLLSDNHHSLTVLSHNMLFKSISFLFIVDIFQFLQQDSQRVSLCELFTLEEGSFSQEIGLEHFRVLSNIAIKMLPHNCVNLPER